MKAQLTVQVMAPGEIDVAATVAVLNDAFRRHTFLGGDRTSPDTIGEELHASCRLVQAFDGAQLVGTATVTPAEEEDLAGAEFPGVRRSRALFLSMAAVPRERMGQGIGARLLSESERLGREGGFEHMMLMTIEEMGNVAYYERFGYTTLSVRDLPAGYWALTIPTHEHAMAKALTATA